MSQHTKQTWTLYLVPCHNLTPSHRPCGSYPVSPYLAALVVQVTQQAKPTAEFINTKAIDPTAAAVEQNARPLADRAVKEAVQPAAKAVAENAEPTADRLINEAIRPAAKVRGLAG